MSMELKKNISIIWYLFQLFHDIDEISLLYNLKRTILVEFSIRIAIYTFFFDTICGAAP